MRVRIIAALCVAAGVAHAADSPKAPNSLVTPIPSKAAAEVVHGCTFTVPNGAGAPGAKKTLTATLRENSPGNPPLEGKTPSFHVSGNGIPLLDLKASQTDAQGKTTVSLPLPGGPGIYDIKVAWKGDAGHKPCGGSGKLTVGRSRS